jgi:amino acid adenylation domain-containing protein
VTDTPTPDVYPLSPMQKGMVFHSVSAPGSDVYVEQLDSVLHGEFDLAAFRAAWETALQRHAPLRTAFAWAGLAEPLQVVGPRVRLPLETLDWRDLSAEDMPARLAVLRREERARGFDLARAPLMRLTLVRFQDDLHHLVWTWHHAILDAWSVPILLEEVFAAYAASREARTAALAPVRPYRDFIAWQQALSKSAAEQFWRAQLDGISEPTPLGIGVDPSSDGDDGYSLELLDISDQEIAGWRAAARAHGVTLNTIVQGAWALLLSRYGGQRDVLFGTAVAGRPAELDGVETMVGLFINTLPVRIGVDPAAPLSAWLQALQLDQVAARRHEHSALADVQGWSGVPRGRPLFDSLLVVEDFPSHQLGLSGGGLRLGEIDFVERANIPLTVMLAVRERSVLGVGFDRNRFELAEMHRLLGHLHSLLSAIAHHGDRPLAELDHLAPDERRLLLDDWSRAPAPVADACRLPDESISRLFEARVRRSPDAPAAVFHAVDGDITLNYATLNARANQLARRLRGFGVGPEERVAICMEASPSRLVAVLAVLKAGGCYVPLDPGLPAALLEDLILDCDPRVVLSQFDVIDAVSGVDRVPIMALSENWADKPDIRDDDLPETAEAGNAAYLIYTSGSTGRRKGVTITHRSLRHLVEMQTNAFGIGPGGRVLQFSSFGFDASVWEIFATLLSGACLYMAPRAELTPSAEMMALLARWEIDMLTIPPSVLMRLPAADLPALKTLVVAGEACPAELVDRWAPGRRFFNAYGPTEATVCASFAQLQPSSAKPSIGRPSGHSRVYLLDEAMRPVSAGVAGQLHIGGPGVARGYWRRPDLTAAAFVPDPFSGEEGARLYRTGDLARFGSDGNIEYLGRVDEQIKIRGFRVEPGEIEAALREQPLVDEAAVLAVGEGVDARLVAFVVPPAWMAQQGAPGLDEVSLRETLRQRLPGYMVPSSIITIEHLPLSSSGKLDRHALLARVTPIASASAHGPGAAPGDETERLIARIWKDLLGLDHVGVQTNFFEQGGHSLLLLAVQDRIRTDAHRSVAITDLFKYPTVEGLARHLARIASGTVKIEPEAATGSTRASARQEARARTVDRRARLVSGTPA